MLARNANARYLYATGNCRGSCGIFAPMDRTTTLAEAPAIASFRLPISRTPIIGRDDDRTRIAGLLAREQRLVTLAGAGGVGKTRLALAVADDAGAKFEGRVGWVSLGELTDPDLLLDALARALGLTLQGHEPLDTLAAAIGTRPALLVVDNMEHLAGESAVLSTLLDRVPSLVLLVTSRAPLRLTAEQEVRIDPFPGFAAGAPLEEHPAIRLFIERARAVDATFAPDSTALARIATIVAQLDFLPLAIELAAARVRHLSLDEIESLLSSMLDLLTGGPRDAPGRQRTIRETISWSYRLLAVTEQRCFRALSVFPGSFRLERAIELLQETGAGRLDVIAMVSDLVDQNLLIRLNEPGASRLVMLGAIRDFGQEQLIAEGEEGAVRARFADQVLERVTPPDYYASDNVRWLGAVEESMDDVRGAMTAFTHAEDGVSALRLANALHGWWVSRGNPREGVRFFQTAFALAPEVSDRQRFDALRGYSWLLALTGSLPQALELRPEIETLAEALEDPIAIVQAEQVLGALTFVQGDFEAGQRHTQHAIEVAEQAEQMPRFKGLLFNMATLAEIAGDYERALDYHRRGVALLDREASPGFWALHLAGMASLALRGGDPFEADRLIREAWPVIAEVRNAQFMSSILAAKSDVLLDTGQPLPAARLFGAAGRMFETFGRVLTDPELAELAVTRERLVQMLPEDELADALAAGRAMSHDELSAMVMIPVAPVASRVRAPTSLLTPREVEVTRLLVQGKTNPEIAGELFISERTVQSHMAHIMAKLGVSTRTAAAARAVREGLVPA